MVSLVFVFEEVLMRRFDLPHRSFDSFSLSPAPLSHPAVQPGQLEQAMAVYLFGDLIDDGVSDWQSAWIDLGGEG